MSALNQPTLGTILSERRQDQPGLLQSDIAAKINQRGASQTAISLVENNRKGFKESFGLPQLRLAVLRAYGFNNVEIRQLNDRFDLELEFAMPADLLRVSEGGPTVRYFGPVNAGMVDVFAADGEVEHVGVPDWIRDRYDLTKVFAMDIVGSSMACEDVQHSIPEGSRVYFLEDGRPNDKEVACVRLFNEGIHVIKVFRPERGYALLESYNHKHKPILLNEDNPGDVIGVYLTHIPRGPRLR